MQPNLVVIQGNTATRYVEGKRDQVVKIDFTTGVKQLRADIEFFRLNGITLETE